MAIVGGGPAGAFCAFELAKKGIYASFFDHSHPREKSCGGGISPYAIKKFPFLERFRSQTVSPGLLKMISCTDKQVAVVRYEGFSLSRKYFDEQIIEMALQKGARIIKEKVLGIKRKQSLWEIKTDKQFYLARNVVGADGINSLVRRQTTGPIPRENLGLTYGYMVTGLEDEPITVKFVAEIPGYIWIFPRRTNTCIGIGSEAKYGNTLKQILDAFIRSYSPQVKVTSKFSAMLPWATNPDFFSFPCSMENGVLIGDAAGHADPVTGEGILYALWSGKLAAKAIAKDDLRLYDKLWMKEYGNYLIDRCQKKNNCYNPMLIEFYVATLSLKKKRGSFA